MTCAASSLCAEASAAGVGVLAMRCSQATVGQLERSADELARASALLSDAMAVLRRNFSAAMEAGDDPAGRSECRRELEAAMVALQCEDALIQMLASLQQRTQQVAGVLRDVVEPWRTTLATAPAPNPAHRGRPWATGPIASRLQLAAEALDFGIARSGPVMQTQAAVGSIDLF